MTMIWRTVSDASKGRRWFSAVVLTALIVTSVASILGSLGPARAQDQAKWWGGAANIDSCPAGALDLLVDRIVRKDTKEPYPGCVLHRPGNGYYEKDDKRARFYVVYGYEGQDKLTIIVSVQERLCGAHGCYWGSTEGWGVLSCKDADQIKGDVLKSIKYPFSAGPASCSAFSEPRGGKQSISITFDPVREPAQTCDKATFLGAWKNDHKKYAMYGAGVTFERSMREGELLGRFSFLRHREMLPYILASTIATSGPPKGCLFPALRGASLQHDDALKYDKATDSFTIVYADGSPHPDFPGRWTRGRPAKAAATCSKDDINGTWHRADGARVLMTGVGVFGNGGHGIMDRYPEDRWPKGEAKFRAVKEVGVCRYEARCTKVTRRTTNDGSGFDVSDAACTLTVDPAKRVMTESGTGTRVYTRVAPNAAADRAAQAREDAEAAKARETAAEAERTARLNREVAERDAAIKRRNAEIKAADERRQREYLEALAAQKAEADRIKREAAAARARYEADMAAWRVRVAACNAGDVSQCQ
jgi:hypothetical protein